MARRRQKLPASGFDTPAADPFGVDNRAAPFHSPRVFSNNNNKDGQQPVKGDGAIRKIKSAAEEEEAPARELS